MGQKYFSGLNYTLGNEDTSFEISLVEALESKKIFSVCGSGGRSLPLCSKFAEELTLSDLSKEQLLLAQLREITYKQLNHEDFLCFWGYFPFVDDYFFDQRKKIFYSLNLSDEVRNYFEVIFNEISFQGLLYLGKWERTFQILAKINRFILGRGFDQILRFDHLDDQKKFYESHFPKNRFNIVLFLLGNKALFNALLYKGDFIEKNSKLSHFQYYKRAFHHLFTHNIANKSFFLHLCFYGKIKTASGVPIEAQEAVHERIQKSKTQLIYLNEDLVSYLSSGANRFDFLSLSDVASYFKGDLEVNFMQMIKPSLIPGAIIVNRYYLRRPDCNLSGFVDVTADYDHLAADEKVQMYDIAIYRYNP